MVWYRSDKKKTTDDLLQLSIGWMKKHKCFQENTVINGGLTWKRSSELFYSKVVGSAAYTSNFIGKERCITLNYVFRKQENIKVNISIVCSFPYFGGKRYWFLCPQCGRKVAFLYAEKYFLCRCCQNLCYKAQQMGYMGRMFEQSNKYQDRVLENGQKKRWIHRTTFEKYLDKSEEYEMRGLVSMCKDFRKLL